MITVAGEALMDLVIDPSGAVTAVPGGAPFNVARTIARLGATANSSAGCPTTGSARNCAPR